MSNKNYEESEEELTVTLTLDDDSELECIVLTIFSAAGRDYIALLPTTGPESESGEVFLYRYFEGEDGQPGLENIIDDEEYEIAADAFDEYLDSQEYDEYVSEEDEE
ncbi:MAG: DUF1292 domain-containing protein [Lachnospiraceae bacterium]